MSNRTSLKRAGRAGTVLAMGAALLSIPAAAQAAPVPLATTTPFVVLSGESVTKGGPSVLYGELGIHPGDASNITGPGLVLGATHAADDVANTAKIDLVAAFNAAAGESTTADLSGQDLGGLTLTAGVYNYSSAAQLTGTVTFDGENNPDAQFIIKVGTLLNTEVGSSVAMIRGANPCNVFWKVDTATIGGGTAFKGNVLALTSISLGNAASVLPGRLLARNGSVVLDNNVIDGRQCGSRSTVPLPSGTPPTGTTPTGTTPTGTTPTSGSLRPPASSSTRNGTATLRRVRRAPRVGLKPCAEGFHATVRGKMIKRVVFSLDGKRIRTRSSAPYSVYVPARFGKHKIKARITFKDATRAKTRTLNYRTCAAAALQPRSGPSQFTG